MQRSRRSNPYPFTWEIPTAVVVGVLLLLVLGIQVGRTIANAIAGNGWVFVARVDLFTSLPGIVAGRAATGLSHIAHPAGAGLLWACVVVLELALVVGCVCTVKAGLDRWGPGRVQGMATRAQAESLLGRPRLRKHAKVIRPDLFIVTTKVSKG